MFRLRFKDLVGPLNANLISNITFSHIVLNVILAMFCGLAIYYVYKKTYSGALFAKNIGVTMVIVTIITSLIVMAIYGNLTLSLGMVGALSIVRFRTPIKDPKDLAFLFWSITTGIICGVGFYKLAFVSVLTVSLCLIVLSQKIGLSSPYLLVIKLDELVLKEVQRLLGQHCEKIRERSATMTHDTMEVVFEVVLRKLTSVELLNKVKQISGVQKAVMVSYEGDLDESR